MGKLFKSLKSQSLAWHIPSTHTTQMHSYPHCTMITTTFHIKNYYPSQVVLRILDEFLSIFGNNQRFIFQVSETLGNPHWENENREQCTSENGKWAPAQKKRGMGGGGGGYEIPKQHQDIWAPFLFCSKKWLSDKKLECVVCRIAILWRCPCPNPQTYEYVMFYG